MTPTKPEASDPVYDAGYHVCHHFPAQPKLSPAKRSITLSITLSIIAMAVIFYPVMAETPALNYHQESTWQQNNPLEYRVTQMDRIYAGKTYDLTGTTGISYYYAHWNNWTKANNDCFPDKIIDIRYYRTLNNPKATYINPEQWTTGDWYYWDGDECNITHWDSATGTRVKATAPLQNDNKFAFTVKTPTDQQLPVPVPYFVPLGKYESPFAKQ
jgi:hypothetical protein